MLRFMEERHRVGRWMGAMRRFSQIIDELELKDLSLLGGEYTWAGFPGNQRMFRLDSFLISNNWEVYFENVNQSTLPKPLPDPVGWWR